MHPFVEDNFDTIIASAVENGFRKYNPAQKLPFNILSLSCEKTDTLTRQTLDFPLVNIQGDTIHLADTSGWKVLYFWNYGCGPCYKRLYAWGEEYKEQQCTNLERAGISMFCINYISGNTSFFRKLAADFGCPKLCYSACDMNTLVIRQTPTYYLVAPNGKIAYSGIPHNDEELIYAKESYVCHEK